MARRLLTFLFLAGSTISLLFLSPSFLILHEDFTERIMRARFMFLSVFAVMSCIFLSTQLSTQSKGNGDCSSFVICPDEELVYEVSWMKIPLGQIRLKANASVMVEGKLRHNASAVIDSYDGLPFVDLHVIDHTEMDESLYSKGFDALEKKGDRWESQKSHYDFSKKLLVTEKALHADKHSQAIASPSFDTLHLSSTSIQDGLSILYFARASTRNPRQVRVPTVVYEKEGATLFQVQNKTEYEEIDAWKDKKIRVVPVEGKAEFEGLFGFTGDFKGWFSDDVAAIPIKAELKVTIGSVKLELIKWKRNGWTPPG